jgi:hypothetical protein
MILNKNNIDLNINIKYYLIIIINVKYIRKIN